MSNSATYELVVIGGSAGSIAAINQILTALPVDFKVPLVVVLHRQKNVESELAKLLQPKKNILNIIEPEDKQTIESNHIYLAPQNYHLLIEKDRSFSLDYSELVLYSRPSIDVTFESCSHVYKNKLLAIILSGANSDGSSGAENIITNGGTVIVQDPATAEFPKMVQSVIARCSKALIKTPGEIADYLHKISSF
jgi:two-component system, chemotaxis family, protein-glutamate methylesterase/glutaminase